MSEYLKKVDLLSAAVEVEYLGRPRLMVSVARIGQMPSIEAVPMEYHNKVCEAMAKRHQEEIADMVSVVRCKECRYCKMKRGTFKGEPIIFYRCTENNRDVESDDYCSWGERSRR